MKNSSPSRSKQRVARVSKSSASPRKGSSHFDQVGFILLEKKDRAIATAYLTIILGAEREISSCGAALTLVRVGERKDWKNVARLAKSGIVDGWLILGEVDESAVRQVSSWKRPIMILGGHHCLRPVASADADHHGIGELVAHHLAEQGHRRIAFLGNNPRFEYQRGMLEGFRDAVKELNLDPDPRLVISGRPRPGVTYLQQLRGLLDLNPRPTAIFAAEPGTSTVIFEMLQHHPDQSTASIELVGCRISGENTQPTHITYVEMPYDEVGRAGVTQLRELVNGTLPPHPQIRVLPSIATGISTS